MINSLSKYLSIVHLHDQRPSTTSTCSKVIGHVTVNRKYTRCQLQRVGFVVLKPDKQKPFILSR